MHPDWTDALENCVWRGHLASGPLSAKGSLTCGENQGQEVEGNPVHGGSGFQELCPEAAQLALASPSPCLILSLQHKREEH